MNNLVREELVKQMSQRNENTLDWSKISEDFDAVHLTSRGRRETTNTIPGLHGWDVESTVWIRNLGDIFEAYIGGIEHMKEGVD